MWRPSVSLRRHYQVVSFGSTVRSRRIGQSLARTRVAGVTTNLNCAPLGLSAFPCMSPMPLSLAETVVDRCHSVGSVSVGWKPIWGFEPVWPSSTRAARCPQRRLLRQHRSRSRSASRGPMSGESPNGRATGKPCPPSPTAWGRPGRTRIVPHTHIRTGRCVCVRHCGACVSGSCMHTMLYSRVRSCFLFMPNSTAFGSVASSSLRCHRSCERAPLSVRHSPTLHHVSPLTLFILTFLYN